MADLKRFLDAQKDSYAEAYGEISAGKKTGHWIWYIFPQMSALGESFNARRYGISSFDEACQYLQNSSLFNNYREISCEVFNQLQQRNIVELMGGSVDAKKLVSSITLFRLAAMVNDKMVNDNQSNSHKFTGFVAICDQLLTIAAEQGYPVCASTISLVKDKIPASIALKPAPDTKRLGLKLQEYIDIRKNEWSFHYNFLGIMSLLYWLFDTITGTDYFNDKSREVKISAATNLKSIIDSRSYYSTDLTAPETRALKEGRLGRLVGCYGGLDAILPKPESSPDMKSHTH